MNNHNYSNTSKQYQTATNASSSAQAAANATTTDAIIIQSNSNVVTDEFIQQLQEQFGGENKQIYILNTNNTSGNTSLTSVNSNTSIASENNNTLNATNNNSQIQYLIVDKDVDINLILQDPSIFNQNQQPIQQQQQQQQQQINMELPPKQIKSQLTQRTTTSAAVAQTINNNNQIAAMNQMLAAEESIQRVQVPPPKRKQFELKLENKKNSYQDVFLRYLAGEKQPTLEITQYEYAHNVVKKPKDNLNYSKLLNNNNNNNNVTTTSNTPGTSNNSMPILSKTISTTPVVSSVNSTQSIITPTTTTATTGTTSQVPANNLDKENYYNSSRRENLLPLNNYEYRNSYKDHYDNQGVRVNPAVLKNLSYSTTSTTQSGVTTTSSNPTPTPIANNRAVNLPATKKIISSNEVIVTNNNKTIINNSILQKPELFAYSNGLADKSINNKSSNINGFDHHMKSNDLVQSTTVSTTTNKNNITQHNELESNNVNMNIEETTTTTTSNNMIEQQQQQIVDEYIDEISFLPGEFLIHKSTFSGDFDNYDIWCVRDDGYLQKYEPVLLATGERCHQSADVLAQYTPDKTEFVLVKVDEKGKTEQDNIVVGVLHNYEPKNRKIFNPQLQITNNSVSTNNNQSITSSSTSSTSSSSSNNNTNNTLPSTIANTPAITTSTTSNTSSTTNTTDNTNILPNTSTSSSATNNNLTSNSVASSSNNTNSSVVVVTYDDLKATLDVFLQALLSQNLNSEFLVKLKEIQDEYFKPSIEFIDSILNEKYVLLMNSLSLFMTNNRDDTKNNKNQCDKSSSTKQQLIQFDPLFKYLFETKPKLISQNLQSEARCKCQALVFLNNDLLYDDQYTAQYVIKFTGTSYNQDNLLPIDDVTTMSDASHSTVQLDKDSINKEFLVCPKTLQFVQLGHMIKHLKIQFYEICQQKIEIVKQISSNNAAPEILNDCLADTQWLIEMFEKFKQLLFEVDNLITINQINDSSETNNQHLESQEQNLMSHHLVVDQVMDNIQLHN